MLVNRFLITILGSYWEALGSILGGSWGFLVPLGSILAASGGALVRLCDSGTCSRCNMLHHVSCSQEVLVSQAGARNLAAASLLAASWEPLGGTWDPFGAS